jgi:hypothetical protein
MCFSIQESYTVIIPCFSEIKVELYLKLKNRLILELKKEGYLNGNYDGFLAYKDKKFVGVGIAHYDNDISCYFFDVIKTNCMSEQRIKVIGQITEAVVKHAKTKGYDNIRNYTFCRKYKAIKDIFEKNLFEFQGQDLA